MANARAVPARTLLPIYSFLSLPKLSLRARRCLSCLSIPEQSPPPLDSQLPSALACPNLSCRSCPRAGQPAPCLSAPSAPFLPLLSSPLLDRPHPSVPGHSIPFLACDALVVVVLRQTLEGGSRARDGRCH